MLAGKWGKGVVTNSRLGKPKEHIIGTEDGVAER